MALSTKSIGLSLEYSKAIVRRFVALTDSDL